MSGALPQTGARDGEGRGRLRALRPVRRALPDGGVGHARSSSSCIPYAGQTGASGNALSKRAPREAGPSRRRRGCDAADQRLRASSSANVNGTGSASANGLLMQAIFRMGIPVSGKNLFPSNIQGLPTWYEIRVNKDGHTARALDYDLVVAMNAETYARDVEEVRAGRLAALRLDAGRCDDDAAARPTSRSWACRSREMCNEIFKEPRERILMKNIAYAGRAGGAARHRHGRHRRAARGEVRARRRRCCESNHKAICARATTTRSEHFDCPLPIRLREDGRDRRHAS